MSTPDAPDRRDSDYSVTVNGEEHALPSKDATVADLVRHLGRDPEQPGIAIAVNDGVVPRQDWPRTALSDGARVEIITAQQGG